MRWQPGDPIDSHEAHVLAAYALTHHPDLSPFAVPLPFAHWDVLVETQLPDGVDTASGIEDLYGTDIAEVWPLVTGAGIVTIADDAERTIELTPQARERLANPSRAAGDYRLGEADFHGLEQDPAAALAQLCFAGTLSVKLAGRLDANVWRERFRTQARKAGVNIRTSVSSTSGGVLVLGALASLT